MAWTNLTDSRKTIARVVTENAEDQRTIAGLAVAGTYKVVIDRTWPLEEISEAHRYVDTGRKRGNVVIRVMEL
jgi:NADPH:quinone reductase-like Zn-dependent oxidoreductase